MAGPIRIAVLADAGQARRELGAVAARATSLGSALGKAGRIAGTAAAGGLLVAGAAAVKVGKDSVTAASDLGESANAVRVTFGDTAKEIRKLSKVSAETVGLSMADFNSLAVQFSAFATTVAGKGGDVGEVMDELTTRGADFASVMNLEVNEAMGLFQSGLAGETEPLRKFGIDLSAAAVQAHAYKEGIAKAGDELTEQQKVQSRYSLLMQQTAKTQGDFKNTSDSLANTQRRLSAQWENAQARLGKGLMPIVEDATGFILDKGIPAFNRFADWFTEKGAPALGDFIDEAKPVVNDMLPGIADGLGQVKDIAKDLAPLIGDVVQAFADMPDWAQKAIVGGGLAAFAASKIPSVPSLGKSTSSLLGKAVGVQKVFETNPAALGGGIGGPGGTPGKGKFPWLAPVGGAATAGTIAAVIAGLGTAGIFKLQQSAAPKAADQGIVGTPNSGVGLKFDDLDSLNDDIDLTNVKIRTITESLQRIAEGRGWFNSVTDGLLDVRVESAGALDKLVGVGGQVDNVDKKKPAVPFEFPNLDRGFKDTEGLIGKIDVTDRKKPTVPFQFPGLEPGIKDTGKLGGDVDRVGKKKPNVPWAFPNLLNGVRDTLGLGNKVDDVGRKKPSVGFTFPNLTPGIANVVQLKNTIDNLRDKTIRITTIYDSQGNPHAGGGRYVDPERRASGGRVVPGRAYWVGEEGPELVVFGSAGLVLSNRESMRRMRRMTALDVTPRAGSSGALRIVGTLDTPFGPAQVRGIAEEVAHDVASGLDEMRAMRARAGLTALRMTGG